MKILKKDSRAPPPRADMFLPAWILVLSILLAALAVGLVPVAILYNPLILIGCAILLLLAVAAYLCWKNQKIVIVSESAFEYTTFLGNTTQFSFNEIKELRENSDSYTLFVRDKKIHIEFCAVMTDVLKCRIDDGLYQRRVGLNNDSEA